MADLTGITDIQAWALYSDLEQTGEITTANEKVNRLYLNSVWSQRDNFLDVPTDCPQRDERMGLGPGDAPGVLPHGELQHGLRRVLYEVYPRPFGGTEAPRRQGAGMSPRCSSAASRAKQTQCSQTAAVTAAGQTPQPSSLGKPTLQRATSACIKNGFESMKLWADWIYRYDEAHGATRLWPGH